MGYYKLTHKMDLDEVIKRTDNNKDYRYCFGKNQWVSTSKLSEYMWPDSPYYDEYVEISEEEANALIEKQRVQYEQFLEKAISMAEKASENRTDTDGKPYMKRLKFFESVLEGTEEKVVSYLSGAGVNWEEVLDKGFTWRIAHSVAVLANISELSHEQHLQEIRDDYAACAVRRAQIVYDVSFIAKVNNTPEDVRTEEQYRKDLLFLNYQ